MGFLKFLKRDKKEPNLELDDLDVPPAPPDIKGKEIGDLPELPEIPDFEEPLSKPEKAAPELGLPAMPDIRPQKPIMGPEPVKIPKPLFAQKPEPQMLPMEKNIPKPFLEPEPKPMIRPHKKFEDRFEKAAVKEEKEVLMHKEVDGPIYVRVDRFRKILAGITTIKNDLKKGDTALLTINEIDENSDKEFDKWKNVMTDLQKKLIFIENALFKR